MIKKLSNKKLAHYMRNNSNVSKHKSRSIRVARTRKNVSRRTRKKMRGGAEGIVKVVEEPVKVPGGEPVKVLGSDMPKAIIPFAEQRAIHNAGTPPKYTQLSPAGPLRIHKGNIIGFPENQSTTGSPKDDIDYGVHSNLNEKKSTNYVTLLDTPPSSSSTDPSPHNETIISSDNQLIDVDAQINLLPKVEISPHTKTNTATSTAASTISNITISNVHKPIKRKHYGFGAMLSKLMRLQKQKTLNASKTLKSTNVIDFTRIQAKADANANAKKPHINIEPAHANDDAGYIYISEVNFNDKNVVDDPNYNIINYNTLTKPNNDRTRNTNTKIDTYIKTQTLRKQNAINERKKLKTHKLVQNINKLNAKINKLNEIGRLLISRPISKRRNPAKSIEALLRKTQQLRNTLTKLKLTQALSAQSVTLTKNPIYASSVNPDGISINKNPINNRKNPLTESSGSGYIPYNQGLEAAARAEQARVEANREQDSRYSPLSPGPLNPNLSSTHNASTA